MILYNYIITIQQIIIASLSFSLAVPCCIGDCFEQYQRPVYGWPKDRSSGVADTTAPAQQRIE